MSKYIYTDGADFSQIPLYDGDRLMQIHTASPMNSIYCIWERNESEEDFTEEVNFALLKKYGKGHPAIEGMDDVSLMTRNLYERYELEAYIGDDAADFDIDAIEDEATEIDYRDGNRYWKDDIDLAKICEKHAK